MYIMIDHEFHAREKVAKISRGNVNKYTYSLSGIDWIICWWQIMFTKINNNAMANKEPNKIS